jgi:DNA ligase-1
MAVKPALARDCIEDKLDDIFAKTYLIASVKVDGVRGFNREGTLLQRSLKEVINPFVRARFSHDPFIGFDGELALTGQETSPSLCRDMGCIRRGYGEPDITWWLFDHVHPSMLDMPYEERLLGLDKALLQLQEGFLGPLVQGIALDYMRIMPYEIVRSVADLQKFENLCLDQGYEGVILRDPRAPHKDGRAGTTKATYWRIKRFIDFEGEVVSFEEAKENQNEAKTNELGRSERSTHQENLVPKGMVGNITLRVLKDVEWNGSVLIAKGQLVVVGPGQMTHEDRIHFFNNPGEFIGQIGKAKFFPHGQLNKPRFPVWLCIRGLEDMSE